MRLFDLLNSQSPEAEPSSEAEPSANQSHAENSPRRLPDESELPVGYGSSHSQAEDRVNPGMVPDKKTSKSLTSSNSRFSSFSSSDYTPATPSTIDQDFNSHSFRTVRYSPVNSTPDKWSQRQPRPASSRKYFTQHPTLPTLSTADCGHLKIPSDDHEHNIMALKSDPLRKIGLLPARGQSSSVSASAPIPENSSSARMTATLGQYQHHDAGPCFDVSDYATSSSVSPMDIGEARMRVLGSTFIFDSTGSRSGITGDKGKAPMQDLEATHASVSPQLPLRDAVSTMSMESSLQIPPSAKDVSPCAYRQNCKTGSPLRKVVSHIFGRNKLSTRQIPEGVWVYYCRKHYQRAKYRNPKGFAKRQVDLVRKQIDRIELWGGIMEWHVKVRKREEIRMNKKNTDLAAGRIVQDPKARFDMELLRHLGEQKQTGEVKRLLDYIYHLIDTDQSFFPDVEILPNILPLKAGSSSTAGQSGQRVAEPSAWISPRRPGQKEELAGILSAPISPHHDALTKRKNFWQESTRNESTPDQRARRTLHRGLNPVNQPAKRRRTEEALSNDDDDDYDEDEDSDEAE
ncbi:MAG: hypothetical protein M1827_004188 [Pycnora praestabilis]|nr:MAG: hypothetical protein M1827_004188 [Pycnora praestabilis]